MVLQALGDHGEVISSSAKMEKRMLSAEQINDWLGLTCVEGKELHVMVGKSLIVSLPNPYIAVSSTTRGQVLWESVEFSWVAAREAESDGTLREP